MIRNTSASPCIHSGYILRLISHPIQEAGPSILQIGCFLEVLFCEFW